MFRKSFPAWIKVAEEEGKSWVRLFSCMVSLMWSLDRSALQGLNSTQSSGRMTGSGHDRLSHPGNLFVALLLLEKAQRAATAHWGGWSLVSLPEPQSSCPAPRFDAAAPTPDHTSCSESAEQQQGHLTLCHVVISLNRRQHWVEWRTSLSTLLHIFRYKLQNSSKAEKV